MPNSWADNDRDKIPFKLSRYLLSSTQRLEIRIQVFLDDDNWRSITIDNPNKKELFMVKGKSARGRQGLTELFFESVEPELADLPIVKFLKRFPEGEYEFEGSRNDGIKLESKVEFTHVIPYSPEVLPEEGSVLDGGDDVVISWAEVQTVVDPAGTDAAGETVCTDPEILGQDPEIESYQVIVENSE